MKSTERILQQHPSEEKKIQLDFKQIKSSIKVVKDNKEVE